MSVFDFSGFDEATYNEEYPVSMWRTFVPCFSKWEEAIWIELDRSAVKDSFIDGSALLKRWKQQNELGRKIMPRIEAAHIGPVPISAFRRVFKFSKQAQEFTQLHFQLSANSSEFSAL